MDFECPFCGDFDLDKSELELSSLDELDESSDDDDDDDDDESDSEFELLEEVDESESLSDESELELDSLFPLSLLSSLSLSDDFASSFFFLNNNILSITY